MNCLALIVFYGNLKVLNCVDVLSQLRAIRNAVKAIELGVLERHVLNCLNEVACNGNQESRQEKMDEIMTLLKKYD